VRTFWAILGVVVAVLVAVWVVRSGTGAGPGPIVDGVRAVEAPDSRAPEPAKTETPTPKPVNVATRPLVTTPAQAPEVKPTPVPEPMSTPAASPARAPAPPAPPAPEPKASPETIKSISDDLKGLMGGSDPETAPTTPPPAPAEHEPAPAPSPSKAVPTPAASAPAAAAPTAGGTAAKPPEAAAAGAADADAAKVVLEPQDDGTTLVDHKYVIRGKGSAEDPYVVSWEMIASAQDTYQPRLGRKVIPGRVKMLDGKQVRLSGYIAFPIMAQTPEEMLVMLNQWDGCCIGVPPTPYDAVEVKLKAAAKGDERLRTSGTVTGVFRVDPYLVKGWLVSLYLMDDGVLSGTGGSAAPGQHAAGGPGAPAAPAPAKPAPIPSTP
jgi:hypothetical protein